MVDITASAPPAIALPVAGVRHDWRAIARPLAAVVIAAFLILVTAWTGIQRGMDHKVAFGPQSEQWAMGIALSETLYGVNLGYIGLTTVRDTLVKAWAKGIVSPLDLKLIENSSNGPLINEALAAAASLGPQKVGYLADGGLYTMYYDDMGEIDFDKLAFGIFGLHIESLYYLFFALLALAALVFILTFHDNALALATLLLVLLAFVVELYLDVFNVATPTYPGMRHGSTLGLVPMWYFVFLLNRRISFLGAVGIAIELAILILAWRIRGSVAWMLILIFAVYAVAGFATWLRMPRNTRGWPELVRGVARWPLVILVLGIAMNGVYNRASLHPIYSTDDVIPYHGLWHSAYLGFFPELELTSPRVQELFTRINGDRIGYIAGKDYADSSHFMEWADPGYPPGYISQITHWPKPRLHDTIMRRAVVQALAAHPLLALKLYGWLKPIGFIQVLQKAMFKAPGTTRIWLLLGGAIGFFAFVVTLGSRYDARRAGSVVLAGTGVAIIATLPNFWAYPELHAMVDLILSLCVLAPVLLGGGAVFVYAKLRR